MCSIRGEIGQEATVQLEGILLSRDGERISFVYWGNARGGGGGGVGSWMGT